ncbi:Thiol-disulfide isomerase or thioredoxin [Pseudooceanicola antarcticus]|uniref:Thiol-disulfide isomerase or thioredoxin n=1 Tax=Pseudooceanicola antarcticus TaxID=1247613 RepID=A0A285IKC2_9RHOB|nr:TlpA disulfide reductase family protein [Pseudooceanicola antarcticus]PJE28749.1 TlpA family protein disulfide reductase [Pseudooceanicola antarcticus]SNY48353.1 Thiol-disulfide isomerase or thioredoxin [Pseudooceanicola antarcticus]
MKKLLSALVYTAALLGAISGPVQAAPEGIEELLTGEMRKLQVLEAPKPLDTTISWDDTGATVSLGDYTGKWVVLNYWAVWCAPCREEMPTLAALQEAREGEDFAVITLASGPNAPEKVAQFLEEEGAAALPHFRDPKSAQARASAVFGLPVTLLVDPEGREVARLIGGADWNSPEAHAVYDAFMLHG